MSANRLRPSREERSVRSSVLPVAILAGWTIFAVWIGWLYSSERAYARNYFTRLAASTALPVYTPGDLVTWKDDRKVYFYRWEVAESRFRWSGGANSALLFKLAPGWNRTADYVLKMHFAGTVSKTQRLVIQVNRVVVADVTMRGGGIVEAPIPHGLLHDADVIDLMLPDATRPGRNDVRVLAVAFVDFVLQPVNPRALNKRPLMLRIAA